MARPESRGIMDAHRMPRRRKGLFSGLMPSPLRARTRPSPGTRVFIAWVSSWHCANSGLSNFNTDEISVLSKMRARYNSQQSSFELSQSACKIFILRSSKQQRASEIFYKYLNKHYISLQFKDYYTSVVSKNKFISNFCLTATREEEDKFKRPSGEL